MSLQERRKPGTDRKAVSLLVKLSHQGVDEFAEKYATNLSPGGMFIRAREPQPIGTPVQFRIEIAGGQRVLQGNAVVRWVRGANDPEGPPGMGVQFTQLDPASQALVDRMLAAQQAAESAELVIDEETTPPAPADGIELDLDQLLSSTPEPPAAPALATDAPVAAPTESFELDFGLGPAPAAAPAAPSTFGAGERSFELDLDAGAGDDIPLATGFELDPPAAAGGDHDILDSGLELQTDEGEETVPLDTDYHFDPTPVAPAAPVATPRAVAPAKPVAPPRAAPVVPPVAPPKAVAPARPVTAPAPAAAAPATAEALPEIRRQRPQAPGAPSGAAPVVLQQAKPVLAKRGTASAPIYLKPPATIEPTGPVIGIDLGTTNSACAVLTRGKPVILNSKDGYNTIPSIVGLTKNGGLVVGHRAKGQMVLNPSQSVVGAKRLVGRDFDSPTVRQVSERFHYEIVAGSDGKAAVTLGANILSLEEVQGIVLRECKQMAEEHLAQPVSRAVITCPAYYSEAQREAVRRAGALAGLKVERILNEPTAAALAYGLNRELSKRVLVYDLGGGTFDATLLRIDKNVFEVLATGGDIFLGGIDFDNQVVDALLAKFEKQHGAPFSGDSMALARIADQAERTKVALSEKERDDIMLPMLQLLPSGQPLDLKCTFTREELNAACGDLVSRTVDVVRDVLLDAKMKASDVDDVILVGGQSRMPMVREKLKGFFNKMPHASVNADEAVALGAALYSGTVDKVSTVVLIDVVPMTIGLGLPGGGFKRIIERNTPLPVSKSFGLSTSRDGEEMIEFNVFQGEDASIASNEYLGTVRIEGLPKAPKGSVQVAVTVKLDPECVLHVEARELTTRRAYNSTLATRYTPEEIRSKLGISPTKASATDEKRAEELKQRGGKFWGFIKRAFGKK